MYVPQVLIGSVYVNNQCTYVYKTKYVAHLYMLSGARQLFVFHGPDEGEG